MIVKTLVIALGGLALLIFIVILVIDLNKHTMHMKKPSSSAKTAAPASGIRYLPLGDSYTIGQSVAENERWPNQLVSRLQNEGTDIHILDNPSVTGYTTQDLIDTELPLVHSLKPTFVSILIGVNDYVQGVSSQAFTKNLDYIVDTVQHQLPNPTNMLLITIPDFGKTPTGAEFGAPAESEAGVEAFNSIITATANHYHIPVADIFPVSQQVASNPILIASDGLHPSGKEYMAWTAVILQVLQAHGLPR